MSGVARPRKIPLRQCAVCGTQRPQREFVRVVRSPEGQVSVDDGPRRLPGRGVYLCTTPECMTQGARGRRLAQRLEAEVPEPVRAELLRRAQAVV